MGALGGVTDIESLKSYLLSGIGGPTHRPVAMLSFLLDDYTWPSPPGRFKYTNLLIHLLNFCILTTVLLELLRAFQWKEESAQRTAVLAAAFWVLHPFLISTTFYVVQRMAQLATLFVLIGLWGYLRGRQKLTDNPLRAHIIMGLSLTLGTLLATLSKENGALLPLLALSIEVQLTGSTKPSLWFKRIFLLAPSLAIIAYLIFSLDLSLQAWPNREFNQIERILTEPRVIMNYLSHLFVPRVEDAGLYNDAFPISKNLFTPPTTLPSIALTTLLLAIGWNTKGKYPIFSTPILFYFSSHLLESTSLGLEIYFEHRNYMGSTLIFLPVASGIEYIRKKSTPVYIATSTGIIIMLSTISNTRATLWGDTQGLLLYWAVSAPESPRAQQALIAYLLESGKYDAARQQTDIAIKNSPENLYLNLYRILVNQTTGDLSIKDFSRIEDILPRTHVDAQVLIMLKSLTEELEQPTEPNWKRRALLHLIDSIQKTEKFDKEKPLQRLSLYLKSRLYISLGEFEKSEIMYHKAMEEYNEIQAALQMVAEMANSEHYEEALRLLNHAENILKKRNTIVYQQPGLYEKEIQRIRGILQERLQQASPMPHNMGSSSHIHHPVPK